MDIFKLNLSKASLIVDLIFLAALVLAAVYLTTPIFRLKLHYFYYCLYFLILVGGIVKIIGNLFLRWAIYSDNKRKK